MRFAPLPSLLLFGALIWCAPSLARADDASERAALKAEITEQSKTLIFAPPDDGQNPQRIAEIERQVERYLATPEYIPLPHPMPQSALEWKEAGNAFTEQSAFGEAMVFYRKALSLDPNYADAMNNIGKIYNESGARERALYWFGRAIEADPQHRVAYANRASVYYGLNVLKLALPDYNNAVKYEKSPNEKGNLLAGSTMGYRSLNQWDEALEASRQAVQFAPDRINTNLVNGLLELESGNLKPAISALQKAVALEPSSEGGVALLQLAQLLDGATGTLSDPNKAWVRETNFVSMEQLRKFYTSPAQVAILGALTQQDE